MRITSLSVWVAIKAGAAKRPIRRKAKKLKNVSKRPVFAAASEFSNFVLPYPDIEEQREIANYLKRECCKMNELIKEKNTLITELKEYKKALIYECVTGKRRVV